MAGYDTWKAREPDDQLPPEHEWRTDEEKDVDYCVRCGIEATEKHVPRYCFHPCLCRP